jgi:hypothetical protein
VARTTGLRAVSGGARGVARSARLRVAAAHRRPATVPEKGREAMVGPGGARTCRRRGKERRRGRR